MYEARARDETLMPKGKECYSELRLETIRTALSTKLELSNQHSPSTVLAWEHHVSIWYASDAQAANLLRFGVCMMELCLQKWESQAPRTRAAGFLCGAAERRFDPA